MSVKKRSGKTWQQWIPLSISEKKCRKLCDAIKENTKALIMQKRAKNNNLKIEIKGERSKNK